MNKMDGYQTMTDAQVAHQHGRMGRWAPWYDLLMTALTFGREKKLRQLEIELSGIKPGDSVLEIGCGTGTLTLAAKERAGPSGSVAGIDLAPGDGCAGAEESRTEQCGCIVPGRKYRRDPVFGQPL